MPSELLTEDEVAALMKVTRHAVRKWRREGKIAFIKVNNTIRIDRQDLRRFIGEHRKAPLCRTCKLEAHPDILR